jgi:ketosteroid isomerase-like protein
MKLTDKDPVGPRHEEVVKTYFNEIRALRSGKEEAVLRLVELWDEDGRFEFAGAPPVVGVFEGRNAIHVLYRNRLLANGMPLAVRGDGEKGMETALGVVDTDVHRVRAVEDKVVAGWTTTVGTRDGKGFDVSGSHTFTFRNGRILSLRIVVSPRAQEAQTENLSLQGLTVDDVGQLSLAAWAVV